MGLQPTLKPVAIIIIAAITIIIIIMSGRFTTALALGSRASLST
jgi:hypothetical protein